MTAKPAYCRQCSSIYHLALEGLVLCHQAKRHAARAPESTADNSAALAKREFHFAMLLRTFDASLDHRLTKSACRHS